DPDDLRVGTLCVFFERIIEEIRILLNDNKFPIDAIDLSQYADFVKVCNEIYQVAKSQNTHFRYGYNESPFSHWAQVKPRSVETKPVLRELSPTFFQEIEAHSYAEMSAVLRSEFQGLVVDGVTWDLPHVS